MHETSHFKLYGGTSKSIDLSRIKKTKKIEKEGQVKTTTPIDLSQIHNRSEMVDNYDSMNLGSESIPGHKTNAQVKRLHFTSQNSRTSSIRDFTKIKVSF